MITVGCGLHWTAKFSEIRLYMIRRTSTAPWVRRYETSRRSRGETEIRIWVPDSDEAKAEIREHAARLCEEAQRVNKEIR